VVQLCSKLRRDVTPKSALIVEDQADARQWIEAALRERFPDTEVHTATTLAGGRAEVARSSFDLALIDIGLPDGSGIDLIHDINRTSPATLAVVTTVFSDDEHLFAALRAGAQGYVLKDDSRERLSELLRDIVAGQPPLSPSIARRLLNHFQAEPPSEVALTERERDVLTLLAKGFTVAKVADLLDITRNTAAGYAKAVYRKLNVSSRAEATLEATRRGLVRP
jgi:DNA-binding NarL/FixJ family response regulator